MAKGLGEKADKEFKKLEKDTKEGLKKIGKDIDKGAKKVVEEANKGIKKLRKQIQLLLVTGYSTSLYAIQINTS